MIDRLLDSIEPQRRHLRFLVGLLVLTFVLTVMLAMNARQADLARQQQAQSVLRDLLAHSSAQWALQAHDRIAVGLQSSMHYAVPHLIRDVHVPLDSIVKHVNVHHFCPDCGNSYRVPKFFSVDLVGRTIASTHSAPVSAELLSTIYQRLEDQKFVLIHELMGMDLVLSQADDHVQAAAVVTRLDDEGRPVRIVGYILPDRLLGDFLSVVFGNLVLLPNTMSKGLPNDSFFSLRVEVGSSTILTTATGNNFTASDTITRPPAEGLVLQVEIRENAATKLLIAGAMSSSLPLLLTLMFSIAGLIVLALLLVRREAELVRLRAEFVSGVSHELRTPLAQIRMFTETLLLGRVRSDVERRRSLEIIDQEARRLSHMVENVLLFSKSEGGRRAPLAPEPTDVAEEVLQAIEMFGPLCRTRNMEMRPELQPHIIVPVDRSALRQIMLNLLENALKYGSPGQRVTVGVALYDSEARVWVDDEGPGIPEPEREKVFDAFHRLDRDVAARVSGSGIGLSVVRELARMHGGEARATAAPGGGARLMVHFPNARLRTASASGLAAAS